MFQYPRRQNVSIPLHQNMSHKAKCFSIPILYTTMVLKSKNFSMLTCSVSLLYLRVIFKTFQTLMIIDK